MILSTSRCGSSRPTGVEAGSLGCKVSWKGLYIAQRGAGCPRGTLYRSTGYPVPGYYIHAVRVYILRAQYIQCPHCIYIRGAPVYVAGVPATCGYTAVPARVYIYSSGVGRACAQTHMLLYYWLWVEEYQGSACAEYPPATPLLHVMLMLLLGYPVVLLLC